MEKNKRSVLDVLLDQAEMSGLNTLDVDQNSSSKLNKLRKTLGSIEWSYERLFEDLNGFVENQEKNTELLQANEQEIARLSNELKTAKRRVDQLIIKLNESNESIKNMRSGYQARVNEMSAVRKDWQSKVQMAQEKRQNSEIQYKNLFESYRQKEKELDVAKSQSTHLLKQVHELREALRKTEKKVQSHQALVQKEQAYAAKLHQAVADKKSLTESNQKLQMSLSQMQDQFRSLQAKTEELKNDKEVFIRKHKKTVQMFEAKDKETFMLKDRLKSFEKRLEAATSDFQKRHEALSQAKTDYRNLKTERDGIKQQLVISESEVDRLNDEKNEKEIEIRELNLEIAKLQESLSGHERLKDDLRQKTQDEKRLANEIRIMQERVKSAQLENQRTLRELDDHKAEVIELRKKELDTGKAAEKKEEELQNKISELQIQKAQLQEENLELNSELKKINVALEAEKRKQAQFDERNDILISKIKKADEVTRKLSETLAQIEKEKKSAEERFNLSSKNAEDLKKKLMQKVQAYNELKLKLHSFEANKEQHISERKDFEQKISALAAKISAEENRKTNEDKTRLLLNDKLGKVYLKLQGVTQQKAKLEEEFKGMRLQLQKQKELYEEKLSEADFKFEQSQEQIKKLHKKIEQSEKDFENQEMQIKNIKKAQEKFLDSKEEAFLQQKQKLESIMTNTKKIINEHEQKMSAKDEETQALREKLKQLTEQNKQYAKENTELNQKFTLLEEQKQKLESSLGKQNDKVSGLSSKVTNLETKEERLDLYTQWLEVQKKDLQSEISIVTAEIEGFIEENPLKSYLKFADLEILKIDDILSKLHAFHPQKVQLEEQRDHFKAKCVEVHGILKSITKKTQDRVVRISHTLKSKELLPAPPLPPEK